MKSKSIFLVFFCMLVLLSAQNVLAGIKWFSYNEALSAGKTEKKKIFIHFYADWCRYCTIMQEKTFNDSSVEASLNKNFISVRINVDREKKTAMAYRAEALPANWFLTESGEAIDFQPGFIPPDMFLKTLESLQGVTNGNSAVKWYNYEEGMLLGQKEKKKAIINFCTDSDPYCKLMENRTYADPSVAAYLSENFVSIRVDPAAESKIASNYGIVGFPVLWFITESGEPIANQPGYIAPSQMPPMLKFIHTDSYKKMSFNQFLQNM